MNIKSQWTGFVQEHGPRYVGGDIEEKSTGLPNQYISRVNRGPIKRIVIARGWLCLMTQWTANAKMDTNGRLVEDWQLFADTTATDFSYAIDDIPVPTIDSDGCANFSTGPKSVKLYPRNGRKLHLWMIGKSSPN